MSVFLKRPKSLFQSRQTFTFHTLQNKSNPVPQIHRNSSQSLPLPSRSADLQAECANVVRNTEPSQKQLDKNMTDKELFAVPETSLSPIHCKKFLARDLTLFLKLQVLTEKNQFMCHKTNRREDS